jgi:hypothetical protein
VNVPVAPDSNPRTFISSFPGKPGRFYQLYHSSDLQTWDAAGTPYNGNGAEITVTTNLPRLYYRLMVSTSDNFPTVTP